jgi:sugar (pentulose or hexulose) kinase
VARKVVGLDIGTTAVRAAEVSVRRGQVVLALGHSFIVQN